MLVSTPHLMMVNKTSPISQQACMDSALALAYVCIRLYVRWVYGYATNMGPSPEPVHSLPQYLEKGAVTLRGGRKQEVVGLVLRQPRPVLVQQPRRRRVAVLDGLRACVCVCQPLCECACVCVSATV
jgi:hypothetical protein